MAKVTNAGVFISDISNPVQNKKSKIRPPATFHVTISTHESYNPGSYQAIELAQKLARITEQYFDRVKDFIRTKRPGEEKVYTGREMNKILDVRVSAGVERSTRQDRIHNHMVISIRHKADGVKMAIQETSKFFADALGVKNVYNFTRRVLENDPVTVLENYFKKNLGMDLEPYRGYEKRGTSGEFPIFTGRVDKSLTADLPEELVNPKKRSREKPTPSQPAKKRKKTNVPKVTILKRI